MGALSSSRHPAGKHEKAGGRKHVGARTSRDPTGLAWIWKTDVAVTPSVPLYDEPSFLLVQDDVAHPPAVSPDAPEIPSSFTHTATSNSSSRSAIYLTLAVYSKLHHQAHG